MYHKRTDDFPHHASSAGTNSVASTTTTTSAALLRFRGSTTTLLQPLQAWYKLRQPPANTTPGGVDRAVIMSYRFDTKRDEAYTEGPLSSATMALMRVAGKLLALVRCTLDYIVNRPQEDGATSGEKGQIVLQNSKAEPTLATSSGPSIL